MRIVGIITAVVAALALHAGFLLFGGIFFPDPKENLGTTEEVDLLSDDVEDDREDEPEPEKEEELENTTEEAPDAAEIIRNMETPQADLAPALAEASLGDLADALSGLEGSGEFGGAMDFRSGGVIGGTGTHGAMGGEGIDSAFSLAEIDQKPRATFHVSPAYPSEMRGKKIEGVVTMIFVVDANGKVTNPRIEKCNHPAFEKPALDAIKKWKFEPGVKGGQRVASRARQTIRFPVSQ